MKTAAAYIRVSTDDQVEYSPASQLEKIKDYAKRNDYILQEEYIFVDEGISGRHTKQRPAFNRMIGIAKTKPKPFDTILLWKYSRFARNREDSIVYKSMLRKQCGIDVISISENVGDDKMSVLIEALIEAMDEYYSINLAEEVKRGMTEKVSRGEYVASAPLGYNNSPSGLIVNKDEKIIIQKIFNDFVSGKSYGSIIKELNGFGYKTKSGKDFVKTSLTYILSNPTYIGKVKWSTDGRHTDHKEHNFIYVDGKHQAIISEDLFNKAAERLEKYKMERNKYQHEQPSSRDYMLRGLVKCSNCGATLIIQQGGKYLQCSRYGRGRCQVSHGISVNKINLFVYNIIQESFLYSNFDVDITEKQDNNENNIKIHKLIEKEKSKLKKIRNAFEEDVYTLEEYKQSKNKIKRNIEHLKSQIIPLKKYTIEEARKTIIDNYAAKLPMLMSTETPEKEKNEFIRKFVSSVDFNRQKFEISVNFYI